MIVFKGEVSSKCKEFLLKEETKNLSLIHI